MNVSVLLDENVSLDVGERPWALGFDVAVVAAMEFTRGIPDDDVFALAAAQQRILISRDRHFTNSVRFPPERVLGIIFISDGNLRGSQEADLVESFFKNHRIENYKGRVIFLSPSSIRIR